MFGLWKRPKPAKETTLGTVNLRTYRITWHEMSDGKAVQHHAKGSLDACIDASRRLLAIGVSVMVEDEADAIMRELKRIDDAFDPMTKSP